MLQCPAANHRAHARSNSSQSFQITAKCDGYGFDNLPDIVIVRSVGLSWS